RPLRAGEGSGGGTDRLRPGARPPGLRLPVLPGARRLARAGRRPDGAPAPVPRRGPRRVGPEGAQPPPVHARHRVAHAARDRVRDGRPARRARRLGRPGAGHGGRHVLRRRRDVAGRRQRGARVRGGQQRAGRLLLPEQPVGDLGADDQAVARAALPARQRVRRPERARRRQRRPRVLRRDGGGAGARAQRRRSHVRRGVHLPHGRAHDVGRPDEVPVARAGGVLAPPRPARAARDPAARRGRLGRRDRGGRRGRGRRAGRAPARRGPSARRARPLDDVRPRLRDPERRGRAREGVVRRLPAVLRGAGRGGGPMSESKNLTLARAINEGLRRSLETDPKVLLMGEDIGALGGVFRVTDGLQKDFGEDRVVDTPLAESGILGTAIGLALRGYRPVCEIQFDGFIFPAYDQITTQLAKMGYRSGGALQVPVVIRVPYGGGIGAVEHHSESPEALFAHTAGLRVVSPSTPQDAYTMIQEAIASPDPVLFFEPKGRYWEKGPVDVAGRGEGATVLDRARVVRPGTDLTLVAYGPTVATALRAAAAAEQEGRSVEVVDLRSISPLDTATVVESVRRPGRCVVVHEAPTYLGSGAEVAARVTEECFYSLEAPVLRVGGFHTPYPVAKIEHDYLPSLDRVLDAVDRAFAF